MLAVRIGINLVHSSHGDCLHKISQKVRHQSWIFKLLRIPRIDPKESIPQTCVAWRAGTTTLSVYCHRPSRIFEHTIFVEVSGHNLEDSVYNVYITNQFQTTFARVGGGGGG